MRCLAKQIEIILQGINDGAKYASYSVAIYLFINLFNFTNMIF